MEEHAWCRTVKRKLDQIESGDGGGGGADEVAARVDVDYEVSALREALAGQQQMILDLNLELEEERSAASTAASETMSMILRLQKEKAEVQMEFRQFKRFAEEKMAHDQEELNALDDLLYKREQTIQSLVCEIEAYKHRLLSCGADPGDVEPQTPRDFDLTGGDYPLLRCTIPAHDAYEDGSESSVVEKYSPATMNQMQELDTQKGKQAAVSPDSGLIRDLEQHFKQEDELEEEEVDEYVAGGDHHDDEKVEEEEDDDDASARVYTIDAVHAVPTAEVSNEEDDDVGVEREKWSVDKRRNVPEDGDIQKLYMRLQALEADRESMRQAIISMRTEKAQLVLLKEIAQQLCKESVPDRKKIVKSPSLISKFTFAAVIKWLLSIFWRKKASRSKYPFGQSNNNVGLLLLLDKSPRVDQWRCLTSCRG